MFSFVRTQNDVNSLNTKVTNTLGVASGILSTQLSGKANLGLESPTAVCPEACCTLISWPHSQLDIFAESDSLALSLNCFVPMQTSFTVGLLRNTVCFCWKGATLEVT